MSQELEEKVARAIMMVGGGCDVLDWQSEERENWHVAMALTRARAALAVVSEAMAEPTPAMLNAGYAAYWKHSPGEGLAEVFAAMLSASPLGEQ